MDDKICVRRRLDDLPGGEPAATDGWRLTSLADVGQEAFASAMLRASQGDPFDESTPESALEDLRDLIEWAGPTFDASQWLLVSDGVGEVGVVLPQVHAEQDGVGTIFYVGVMPQRRGAGLGKQLHRLGLERLRALGVREYVDSTDARNVSMLAIFAANGCSEVGSSETGDKAVEAGRERR